MGPKSVSAPLLADRVDRSSRSERAIAPQKKESVVAGVDIRS